MVTLRWAFVVALLFCLYGRTLKRDWPKLKPHVGFLFLMGALGLSLFNGVFYLAAHYTSAINMGIISGIMPVFVLLGGLVIYRARVRALQWVGAIVTLVGVGAVASSGSIERLFELELNAGDLLALLASVLYAGYTVGLRRRPDVSAISLFIVLATSALVASIPMVGIEIWMGDFQAPSLRGWGIVLLVAIFPSLLAQMMFIQGVEIIGPNRAGIFLNLVPIFSAAIAVGYLGEAFELYHGVALVLVLGGIWLAERGAGGSV